MTGEDLDYLDRWNADLADILIERLNRLLAYGPGVRADIQGLLAHCNPGISMAELFKLLSQEYIERHHPEEKFKRAQARAEKKKAEPDALSVPAPEVTPKLTVTPGMPAPELPVTETANGNGSWLPAGPD